jgi:hypothetical protein
MPPAAGVGPAARGKVPFLDTIACFMACAYDQVRMAATQPGRHQPVRIALPCVDRRGESIADSAGGYRDISRRSFLDRSLPKRCNLRGELAMNLSTPPPICLAEMPKASRNSSDWPECGVFHTAMNCLTKQKQHPKGGQFNQKV